MTITQLQTTASSAMPEAIHRNVDWERIFREHGRRLHHFIRKRVSNREDAEDLEQMTWVEVLRNRDKFSGASRPETWVFGIALNLVRNHFRLQSGRPRCDELEEDIALTGDDPSHIIEHQRLLTSTLSSIASLPEETRHLLRILIEQDGSYQAIALHLNIPIGTVRSRLSRARGALKQSVF
ncbi:sigma-70 family RNA polymerase sigma factor [Klebsiella indica]|uniref:Sigma-70 family RNA polymerase sigma factor n=1 Tax=Klebsiella indica TaxID=2582917 RepID=A0A5R9LEE5_9ENTR|nr:sigma-70 family RNA polymerase sigma factor [Klebsiella indica]TLV11642.1 sigma-70 family RNA polymerase sigma factor [Klebsiella indica]